MRAVRGAEIALIFQEPMTALNPVFTVGDQIAETLLVHGRAARRDAQARAVELLEAVRIPDAARARRDYPHQLSGGMRQRVLIAMALACRPSLVIADEPTTALDVTIQAQILDLLRDMKPRFSLSLLLITHDLGVIAETADRVAVMYAGRIVEQAAASATDLSPGRSIPTRRRAASTPARPPAGLRPGRHPCPIARRRCAASARRSLDERPPSLQRASALHRAALMRSSTSRISSSISSAAGCCGRARSSRPSTM